mgnify:CR=1 FL=1
MLQANNQLLEHSIVSMYVMENIWYFVFAGLLSYNLPLVFKLKQESGYLIRAGIMVLMSMAIVPRSRKTRINSLRIKPEIRKKDIESKLLEKNIIASIQ